MSELDITSGISEIKLLISDFFILYSLVDMKDLLKPLDTGAAALYIQDALWHTREEHK